LWLVRKRGLAIGLALLCGCAAPTTYIANDFVASGLVAVLPMTNESNDLDGPPFLRRLLQEGLAGCGFRVLPLEQIDAQLKTQGFTDGGQLHAATPRKIGEWTGADSLLYSTIENFDYINIGFYAQRRVKIVTRLVDAKTGERLWEAERETSTRKIATNKRQAERLFAIELGVKAFEKMLHKPLEPEARITVAKLLNALPRR
jgi:hypothetical protein